MELKSKNPLLNNKAYKAGATTVYDTDGRPVEILDQNSVMTVNGAVNKSFIMLALLIGSAFVVWQLFNSGINVMPMAIGGAILGIIVVMVATFKPNYARYLAPAYAVLEGLFIGAISAIFEMMRPGMVMQAVFATFVTFVVCFLLYRFKVVKVTEQFKSVVIGATLAIFTFYMLGWIMSMFGVSLFIYGSSMLSIGFSILVIVIAALNLFLDFNLIEEGARRRLPKYMEWFSAMALMITLVWLYLEFLKLLAKLSSRD